MNKGTGPGGLIPNFGAVTPATDNGTSAQVAVANSQINDTGTTFSATVTSGTLTLFATLDNSGPNATMIYSVKRWSDSAGGPTGLPAYTEIITPPEGYVYSSYAMSDGSSVPNNCQQPIVVGGKTRVALNYSYTMGVGPGTTTGDIDVILDGLELPRYLAGVTTTAYWKEIDSQTIELNRDYTSVGVSIETRKKYSNPTTGSGGASSSTVDAIVGSLADVSAGRAAFSSINTAIASSSPGSSIFILQTYNGAENITIDRQILLSGKGFGSTINGNVTFTGTCDYSALTLVRVTGNIAFNSGSVGNLINNCWQNSSSTVTDNGTGNVWTLVGV